MSPVPATRPLIRTLSITAICILLIALSLVLTRRQQARNSSFKSARNHSSVDLFDPDKGRITPEATTIVVNTLSDAANGSDGLCTLREAITAANNNVPSGAVAGECAAGSSVTSDTIDLTAISGTISLNNGLFPINSDLSINGLGPGSLTIQRSTNPGTPGFRIFMINSGRSVSINGLTLGNGLTGVNEDGGAINNGGTLTMTNCNLFGNTATPSRGGAIYSNGASVTLNNCQIGGTSPGQANTSGAGAIYGPNITMVGGSVVGNVGVGLQLTNGNNLISGVAITDNIGALDGGGIETFPFGTVKIVNSLIANNTAARRGGGIDSLTTMTIVNSTISGNRSAAAGGGINGGGLTLVNVTVTNNRCDSDNNGGEQGGGLNSSGDLTNTLIAGNFRGSSPGSTADDATGNLLTGSNNLIGAGGSGGLVNGVNNNQVGVIDPKIGPLSNNGGSLQTHALLAGSPALDAGSNAAITSPTFSGPPFTDQRGTGFDRISDGNADATATVDIGAFEAQKIVVTNTNDSGAGSLRQAILDANANPGADTITFNIPGAGVHTITPASLLPAITDQVLVDGYTQPGASRNTLASGDNAVLLIELDGTVIAGSSGLTIRASNCELRGFVINRFAQGIFITSSSGTTQTTGNLIQGNFIGTNASGNSSLPNSEGILIQFSNHDQIGGTTPDARNVIAGNAARGVNLSSFSSATMIQGNFIGTNASGKALVNPFSTATGILSGGSGSDIIGGTVAGSRNIISGNNQAGVIANSSTPTILGNYIGTDVTGTVAVGNGFGVWINSFQAGTSTIGGTASGAPNLISGNKSDGVFISGQSTNVQVLGNLIGTDVTGTQALGNQRNGVQITEQAANNKVGGVLAGQGNIIAFNTVNGVLVSSGTANSIRGNSILANGTLGIDLGGNGVSPNDAGDGDPGPNNLQNFPMITRTVTGAITTVQGTLNTTPNSSGVYFIDFYTNAGCDGNGNGEGRTYIGSVTAPKTDENGNVAFTFNPPSLVVGEVVTATATDTAGNTSEFSACRTIQAAVPGALQFSAANYPSLEGDSGTHVVLVSVTRAGGIDGAVSVHYATGDGTATTGNSDYDATSGDLNWPDGDNTSRTFNVTVRGDVAFESDETINLTLSSPQLASLGSPNRATITITNDDAQGGFLSFSQSNYPVSESAGFVTITVNRTNDVSRATTVDYATDDTGTPATCGTVNGLASSRCDFTRSGGTLTFAAGDTQKTFSVLINRDTYVESAEMFTVNLSNPTGGAILATPFSSTVTINDDNTGLPSNASDDPNSFVRMHYHDFLNREADQSGLDFWTNQITSCGSDTACTELRRINVSAAFFLSIEFQDTGYLVERLYKTAYGDAMGMSTFGGTHQLTVPIVRFNEFLPDTQEIGLGVVVGQGNWQQQLETNKQAFASEFVQRVRFTTAFPTTLTPAQFVGQLNTNAGNVLSSSERTTAIGLFGSSPDTSNQTARAQALRQIAEDADLNSAEFNRAFVLMQYFGYLRRNPNDPQDTDYTGYDFWLTKLNQFNGNFVNAEMVKAFISSSEYRERFGP